MISTWLMKSLWLAYLLIFIVSLLERNWPRAVYWLGACVITTGVIMMGIK